MRQVTAFSLDEGLRAILQPFHAQHDPIPPLYGVTVRHDHQDATTEVRLEAEDGTPFHITLRRHIGDVRRWTFPHLVEACFVGWELHQLRQGLFRQPMADPLPTLRSLAGEMEAPLNVRIENLAQITRRNYTAVVERMGLAMSATFPGAVRRAPRQPPPPQPRAPQYHPFDQLLRPARHTDNEAVRTMAMRAELDTQMRISLDPYQQRALAYYEASSAQSGHRRNRVRRLSLAEIERQAGQAAARAWTLLVSHLTEAQVNSLEQNYYFEVTGEAGTYRIFYGGSYNIQLKGRPLPEYCRPVRPKAGYWGVCFMPAGGLAMGDKLLTQKLAIEVREPDVWRAANASQLVTSGSW